MTGTATNLLLPSDDNLPIYNSLIREGIRTRVLYSELLPVAPLEISFPPCAGFPW